MCLAHRDVGRRGRRLAGGAFDPGSRELLERVLPGAFGQAVADAEAPFGVEVPSLQGWPRGADGSRPGFRETQEAVLSWLPDGEALVVPRATHLLQIANPRAVAEGLADFLARHPS
jgi:hypothetical protein